MKHIKLELYIYIYIHDAIREEITNHQSTPLSPQSLGHNLAIHILLQAINKL